MLVIHSDGPEVVQRWLRRNLLGSRAVRHARILPQVSSDCQIISNVELDPKQNTYLAINTIGWNVKTVEKLFSLSGLKFDVNGLIFTRDDRYLLTGKC